MKPISRFLSIALKTMALLALLQFSNVNADNISGAAPNFTLKSNSGKNLKLSEYRGQVVLLNFWASWCAPCRQEMPLLNKIQKRYQPLGFTILGVNVEEDSAAAKKMLRSMRVNFPILFDTHNIASKAYNVSAMPSTVLIDKDGKMRYLHKGYKPGDEATYVKWVKKLLKE